ncbi:hypothetical protein B0H63DRAFT_541591 [Podospora didyma]|uniref:Condensation domain-containing protein n=1 Tax=Podospora didyma TaxID=330526 RepID=A0AAE0NTD9_9PEZI|nr:hypothetical protein B0H63DRAFT_541591 [Podospora didyma]
MVRPKLHNPYWQIQDSYTVTGSQALDVRATVHPPRTSIQYNTLYFDNGVDISRLQRACSNPVKTHDILRTVFIEHGSAFLQVVLQDLDVSFISHHTTTALDAFVVELPPTAAKTCLIIALSHSLYDGICLPPKLLRDLEALYSSIAPAKFAPFSSYLGQTLGPTAQADSRSYWRNLHKDSNLSIMPVQSTKWRRLLGWSKSLVNRDSRWAKLVATRFKLRQGRVAPAR